MTQRFYVGLRGSSWILISDGVETYSATEDVRYFCRPPELFGVGVSVSRPRNGNEGNRIRRVELSDATLESYCASNGLTLRPQLGSATRISRIVLVGALGALLGTWYGGWICALAAAAPLAFCAGVSEFAASALREVFERARAGFLEWGAYDTANQKLAAEQDARADYIAQDNWARFYRLRSFACVDSMSGVDFEIAVAEVYRSLGYTVTVTKASGDFGVDVIAEKGGVKLAIQTKRYQGAVGVDAVQEAASGATYYSANRAVVVTNSSFTAPAIEFAGRVGVELVGRASLAKLWREAHRDEAIPPFDRARYEELKEEILSALRRLNSPASSDRLRRL
jgi:hypothetical protein